MPPLRRLGEQIDHYELVQSLGDGGFASAYRARDTRSGRDVVLKWPDEVLLGDPTVFERFRREMAITRALHHPNIQSAVDTAESRSAPYLVLEYVDAVPLHRRLRERGRLPVAEAAGIARQLASALQYMHGEHVYHRDLKPENVLITPEGTVKIIDFGVALMDGARRMTWQYLTNAAGTPAYMAPEQIQGKRGDARTDLYALGILLYELLKGCAPYGQPGDDAMVVMQEHLSGRADALPPAVPPGLAGIVAKCIRRDPEERYQSAEALLADLDRYQKLTAADFPFEAEREARVPNAERRILVLGGVMAVAFVCIVAVILALVILAQHASG